MCVFLGGSLSQGMVIAETKRQMHETLEMKEEEVAQLRGRVQQAVAQKEELQEQKEKNEKSGRPGVGGVGSYLLISYSPFSPLNNQVGRGRGVGSNHL